MNDEIFFLYKEHLEYTRLYLWYQNSTHSFFYERKGSGKMFKVEEERCRYLSQYYFQELVTKVRKMVPPK